MKGILLQLAENYALAARPSRSVKSGVVFGDGFRDTLFCEAAGFYTLAVAAASCEKNQEKCKEKFTEIAKRSLRFFLNSREGIGVCEDGVGHDSPAAGLLYSEGALLLGMPCETTELLPSAFVGDEGANTLSTLLEDPTASDAYSSLFVAAAGIRIALLKKSPPDRAVLTRFCRATVRVNDLRYSDGSAIFPKEGERCLSLQMHAAESLFARLQGVDLALPQPPKRDVSSPSMQHLEAEENAYYAYAVAASFAARMLVPTPLLSAEELSFSDGERTGLDGYPFSLDDRVMTRGGMREASALAEKDLSLRFLPTAAPRLLSDSLLGVVNGIYPRHTSVSKLCIDVTMKGGFLLHATRDFSTGLFGDVDPRAVRLAHEHVAYAVLPDDETALLIAVADADVDGYVTSSAGLCLRVNPTDGGVYYYADARHAQKPLRKREGDGDVGCYLNVGDRLGIVTSLPMTLTRGDGKTPDEFSILYKNEGRRVSQGERLYSFSAALAVGGIRKTRALAEGFLTLDALPSGVFSASAMAANRKRYTLLYNLSGEDFLWEDRTVENGNAVLLVSPR